MSVVDEIMKYVWITVVDGAPVLLHNPEQIQRIVDEAAAPAPNTHEIPVHSAVEAALTEVMGWIDGWNPAFEEDPEWSETRERVEEALDKKEKEPIDKKTTTS